MQLVLYLCAVFKWLGHFCGLYHMCSILTLETAATPFWRSCRCAHACGTRVLYNRRRLTSATDCILSGKEDLPWSWVADYTERIIRRECLSTIQDKRYKSGKVWLLEFLSTISNSLQKLRLLYVLEFLCAYNQILLNFCRQSLSLLESRLERPLGLGGRLEWMMFFCDLAKVCGLSIAVL